MLISDYEELGYVSWSNQIFGTISSLHLRRSIET